MVDRDFNCQLTGWSMTTAEIKQLLEQKPEWLVVERATQAAVHEENARIKFERRAKSEHRQGGV